jgi:prepilin-type processing-associated H-X9-DG protein
VVSYAWSWNINSLGVAEGQQGAAMASSTTGLDLGGVGSLKSPSKTVMFCEVLGINVPNLTQGEIPAGTKPGNPIAESPTSIGNSGNGSPTLDTGPLGDEGVTWTDPAFPTGRHTGGSNFACWDGHVKWFKGSAVCQGGNEPGLAYGPTSVEVIDQNFTPVWNVASGTQAPFKNGTMPAITFSVN